MISVVTTCVRDVYCGVSDFIPLKGFILIRNKSNSVPVNIWDDSELWDDSAFWLED